MDEDEDGTKPTVGQGETGPADRETAPSVMQQGSIAKVPVTDRPKDHKSWICINGTDPGFLL